jgi:CPA1 family monovalent cation:H+ antiporter
MFTVPWLMRLVRRDRDGGWPARDLVILSAGGMRGAVSVAVALAIPLTVSGRAFPDRDAVVLVALAAVVILLVVPALLLPVVLRRTGLGVAAGEEHEEEQDERTARVAMAEAALQRVRELGEAGEHPQPLLRRAEEVFEARLATDRNGGGEEEGRRRDDAGAYRAILRELIAAERDELHRLSGEGRVSGQPLRRLERSLDLDERRYR